MNIFKRLVTYSLIALPLVLAPCSALAQGSGRNNTFGGIVQLDKTVHDFGDILVSDGPVTAVFTVKNVREQGLSLALCLTEDALAGKGGAFRVHGGGFAGTIQAFVPHAEVEGYRAVMNAAFGDGACVVMSIRPEGAIKVY